MSQGIYPAIFQRSTTFLTKFLSARQVGLLSNMVKTNCPCTGQYFQTGKGNAISNIYSLKARLMTRSNMQKIQNRCTLRGDILKTRRRTRTPKWKKKWAAELKLTIETQKNTLWFIQGITPHYLRILKHYNMYLKSTVLWYRKLGHPW